MPRKITELQKETLINAWGQTQSVSLAAARAGISRPTAEKYLKNVGCLLPKDISVLGEIQRLEFQCRDCGSTNVGVLNPAKPTDA